MGDNARRQTLQVNELLDERECGRDHGLRGDKLHSPSVADLGNRGRTHGRENREGVHNPMANKVSRCTVTIAASDPHQ